jgi:hypothetical protein
MYKYFPIRRDEMKLLIIAVAISLISFQSFAVKIRGGDMPFPIGKVIDFPKDDGKGVWKDELKKKIFRLRPLKGVLPEGTILVQMLGLQKNVLAEGVGIVGEDNILRAKLQFVSNKNKFIYVHIANLCNDLQFDAYMDDSSSCKKPAMWASMEVHEKYQKIKAPERFMIRRTSLD